MRRVYWWQFWNPNSGLTGGLILGSPLGVVFWCVVVFALATSLGGCGTFSGLWDTLSGGVPPPTGGKPQADPFWALSWVALLCLLAGAAGLVASFVIPIVPRSAAGASLGVGIALLVAKAFLIKFMGVLVWGLAGVLLWLLWSLGRRFVLDRLGRRLAKNDPRAGVAVMSLARGWTGTRAKPKRKKLLERYDDLGG